MKHSYAHEQEVQENRLLGEMPLQPYSREEDEERHGWDEPPKSHSTTAIVLCHKNVEEY